MTTTETTRRQQYVALTKRKRELEGDLKKIDADLKAMHEALLEEFLAEGMQSCSVDGMKLYMQRTLRAGRSEGRTSIELVEAMRAVGWEEMTTANWSQLSSQVRELARDATGKDKPSAEEAEAALPPELRGFVAVREDVKIVGTGG